MNTAQFIHFLELEYKMNEIEQCYRKECIENLLVLFSFRVYHVDTVIITFSLESGQARQLNYA